jgi:endonuclease/exonuclease/phosphatase (EEP) superfamily protein YafD
MFKVISSRLCNSKRGYSIAVITVIAFMLIVAAFNPWQFYYADLLISFRFPLLAAALFFALLLLALKKLWLGGVIAIICIINLSSLVPLHSLEVVPSKAAITVKQINLNYNNPYVDMHLKNLQNQQWDVLVLQEFSDLNRHLLTPFLNKASLFGYREVEGIPYGIVVISRLPIIHRQQVKLDGDRLGYIKLKLLLDKHPITAFIAHPPSPRTATHWHNRNRLLSVMNEASTKEIDPWFIAGDLNIVPWSGYFNWSNAQSCYAAANAYTSFAPTAIEHTLMTGLPIDHCIFNQEFNLSSLEVSEFKGSDHKILSYTLNLKS